MKGRAEFPYTKLPGALRGFVRRASLWESPDHLLSVTGTRFTEEYRRFYYRDVESIVVQKCARAGSFGLWFVCGIALLISGLVALHPANAIAGAIACLFLFALIVRLILSLLYSCRCYIQTAVSREELPSLLRTWSARKSLERIRSRIEEAQGALPEEVGSLQEVASATVPAPAEPAASAKLRVAGVRLAIAAFLFILADAAESFWSLNASPQTLNSIWLRIWDILGVSGEGACIVLALLCIYKWRTLRPLRNLLLGCLVFLAVEVWFSLYFPMLYMTGAKAMHVAPHFYRAWHWLAAIFGSMAGVLALGGFILILLKRETYPRGDLSIS
ncbi:MAG: hypothetical protein ACRD34_13160 [Bryobacteraceae bacterium]